MSSTGRTKQGRWARGSGLISSLRTRHFDLLVALDDLRNVRKTAEAINVTQPAVSKTLAEMESRLGVRLFDRLPDGLAPTPFGRSLIRHAREVLATLLRARDDLDELRSGDNERFTVGTNPHVTVGVIPRTILLMKQRLPKVTIVIREGHTEAHLMALWLGQIDAYVGRIPREWPQGLGVTIFSTEPMRLVTGVHHPLVKSVRLRWQNLQEYPWVLPPNGTQQRELLDRAFEMHGLATPQNRIETLSVHTVHAYLNSTHAIAAVAPQVARYYEAIGSLKSLPLAVPNGERSSGIAWNKERASSPVLEEFIRCVESGYQMPVHSGAKKQNKNKSKT
jgi:DNA-binding transcriptional LysR family regulator